MNSKILVVLFIIIYFLISCNKDDSTTTPPTTSHNCTNPVTIGTQIWMCKNLDVDHYRNGDSIPEVRDSVEWSNLKTGAWCYFNNESANGSIYGKLYNWYAVNDSRGLAPVGWHIPSQDDWKILVKYLGGNGEDDFTCVVGSKLKESGISHWLYPNPGATNESGFTALPGGFRKYNGSFIYIGYHGDWWSSTEYTEESVPEVWKWGLNVYTTCMFNSYCELVFGFSVRCIKD